MQQSYPPQLTRSGGTRVSLTGEVIHDDVSSPPPSYVGGAPGSTVGLAKPAPLRGSTLTEQPSKPSSSPLLAILIGLLVVGGLGAGGWWFLMPHSNPKTVVQQFEKAAGAQDWKAVYPLVELPADTKAQCPDAAAFATYMTAQLEKAHATPMGGPVVDAILTAYQTAQVGEPVIDGDSAKVPVTLKVSLATFGASGDKPMNIQVPLHKVGGVWKIDGLQAAAPGGMSPGGM